MGAASLSLEAPAHSPALMPSPVQVGLKLEAVQQATAEGCRAVIITGLAA